MGWVVCVRRAAAAVAADDEEERLEAGGGGSLGLQVRLPLQIQHNIPPYVHVPGNHFVLRVMIVGR